jgi:hypothetical protein
MARRKTPETADDAAQQRLLEAVDEIEAAIRRLPPCGAFEVYGRLKGLEVNVPWDAGGKYRVANEWEMLAVLVQTPAHVEMARTRWFVEHHQRKATARNRERDAEIVRLRDQEGHAFGKIGRLLVRKTLAWGGRDGRPLSRGAVEQAYRRAKRSP